MILITGANGQLGNTLRRHLKTNDAIFLTSSELNILDKTQLSKTIEVNQIKYIVNCAAYTQVDKAETDYIQAHLINETGVMHLALASAEYRIPIIHISTDYVFDGTKNTPYNEEDKTNPTNVYGASKLAGEKALLTHGFNSTVIRTSWLYSNSSNNFVYKVIDLLKTKPEISMVYDQIGTPTYCDDLAECIVLMLNNYNFKNNQVFHYSNEGVASWYDFACSISKITGIKNCIKPVYSSSFPGPVKRPSYSVLAKDKIKNTLGININHWLDSLEICLNNNS